jgi:ABC-type lipoprotein export system ATPase subunit
LITLENLSKSYRLDAERSVTGVADVNLTIQAGDFIAITGRSGAGKTTLLNLIAGLTPPSAGRVLWDGVDLWSLSDAEISQLRNQKIGFAFQIASLLPFLSVFENLILPTTFSSSAARAAAPQRARELLQSLGLEEKAELMPRQLSAGEQQRITIARALVNRPALLLADEPTSNLDEQTEKEIMRLLAEIHQTTSTAIVMVSHAAQEIPAACQIFRMNQGRLVSAEGA